MGDSAEWVFIIDDKELGAPLDIIAVGFPGHSGEPSRVLPLILAHHTNPRINGHAFAHLCSDSMEVQSQKACPEEYREGRDELLTDERDHVKHRMLPLQVGAENRASDLVNIRIDRQSLVSCGVLSLPAL